MEQRPLPPQSSVPGPAAQCAVSRPTLPPLHPSPCSAVRREGWATAPRPTLPWNRSRGDLWRWLLLVCHIEIHDISKFLYLCLLLRKQNLCTNKVHQDVTKGILTNTSWWRMLTELVARGSVVNSMQWLKKCNSYLKQTNGFMDIRNSFLRNRTTRMCVLRAVERL